MAEFRPDVMLIDKKPGGIKNELDRSLAYAKRKQPHLKTALILRDILDTPERTIAAWERQGQSERVERYYDAVLVLGERSIFDQTEEYRFPSGVADKIQHCGYLGKAAQVRDKRQVRRELGVGNDEPMVLVTPGGGEDGFPVIEAYARCLAESPRLSQVHSVVVTGPEMPALQRERLAAVFGGRRKVRMMPFAEDLMSVMNAADAVVSMGGYNTVCELMSLRKRAVVVPRAEPVAEQWIRTERLADRGLFTTIHPKDLTPIALGEALSRELMCSKSGRTGFYPNMCALDRIAEWTDSLFEKTSCPVAVPPLRSILLPCL